MPFTTPTCLLGTLCVGKGRNTLPCVCPAIQMINDSFITGGALIRSLSYLRQVKASIFFASQQNNGHAYFFQQEVSSHECGKNCYVVVQCNNDVLRECTVRQPTLLYRGGRAVTARETTSAESEK
jgi:hypothetical protein